MEPETKLRASINGLAMKKVTRFFNATTEAIVGEMLQNARRAGATKVRIRTKPKAITIDDDGVGIAEPGQLLEFGSSGWSDQRTRAEDPAGMGFFSLARRNAEVESWPRDGAGGWRICLEPKHFTGEAEGSVTGATAANGPRPSGTRVTFEHNENVYTVRNEIRKLCRHYPVQVCRHGRRGSASGPLPQGRGVQGNGRRRRDRGVPERERLRSPPDRRQLPRPRDRQRGTRGDRTPAGVRTRNARVLVHADPRRPRTAARARTAGTQRSGEQRLLERADGPVRARDLHRDGADRAPADTAALGLAARPEPGRHAGGSAGTLEWVFR